MSVSFHMMRMNERYTYELKSKKPSSESSAPRYHLVCSHRCIGLNDLGSAHPLPRGGTDLTGPETGARRRRLIGNVNGSSAIA